MSEEDVQVDIRQACIQLSKINHQYGGTVSHKSTHDSIHCFECDFARLQTIVYTVLPRAHVHDTNEFWLLRGLRIQKRQQGDQVIADK